MINATSNKKGAWTKGGQQRTYKNTHNQDNNTLVRNKTQIVLGYQLNVLKIVSNPGLHCKSTYIIFDWI